MSQDFAEVRSIVVGALDAGIGTAAQLAIGDAGALVAHMSFGKTAREGGHEVGERTLFDVASLTKIVATTGVAVSLVAEGRLRLEDELPGGYTVRHLLAHSAGLHWWKPLYETVVSREGLLHAALATPPDAPPGQKAVYSDLSFIVLGDVLERAGGARIDVLAEERVWRPLGMSETRYVDLGDSWRPDRGDVVATEACPRRGLLWGEVHDDNTWAAGGVCAHAGVFSTALDLSRFAAAWCASWQGHGLWPREVVREFSRREGTPGSTRALGWDTPSDGAGTSQAGDLWPREDAVGHGGFTGTSMWLDLRRGRWVVWLTNRVHPSRTDERIKQVRPRLHDAIVRALDA